MKTCRKIRIAIIAAVVLTAVAMTASAVSGSTLKSVYDAGASLLFDTSNVTLNGTADFSLDGTRFKMVEAQYIQDGFNSVWDYKLYTPRQEEGMAYRESGYTVYASDELICTVDRSYPGTYRNGYDEAQNTLVRRSAAMDQAAGLAGAAVACMEPLLPEGAVQVIADNHTGKTLRVTLDKSSISELTNTAFSLAAQMVIRRAIEPVDFDYLPSPYNSFYDFLTPAKAIINCTRSYNLSALDVTVTVDGNGNLRALKGSMSVTLDLLEECVAEGEPAQHSLDIAFDVTASNYGTSKAAIFNPEAEGLTPQWSSYWFAEELFAEESYGEEEFEDQP